MVNYPFVDEARIFVDVVQKYSLGGFKTGFKIGFSKPPSKAVGTPAGNIVR
jgi:hypothetical protein